jgi:NTE family protein
VAERCYCIFEGGGAKGVAHVGALAAFERSHLELVGFAGTSAGAIVAALGAAGYRSDELLGSGGSILDRLDLDPTNVWGFDAHWPIASPPRLLGRAAWLGIRASGFLLKFGIWVALALLVLSSGLIHWLNLNGEAAEFAIQLSLVILLVLLPLYIMFPLASLRGVADAINQALALKIRHSREKGPVTFRDLALAGRPPLKIVASDISRRRLALFSAQTSPDVAIGDAVAASICLPGIFRPWRVGQSLHLDGGLLSNLPVWAFDAERAVDRDAWTAAIEIAEKLDDEIPPRRGYALLASTISTALFGSDTLNTRGVDRLRITSLKVDLGLLEFNMKLAKAKQVIEGARDACWSGVVFQIDVLPRQIESICERIVKDSRELIQIARENQKAPPFLGQIRAALQFPIRDTPGVLLNEFAYGYSDHSDERMKIPLESSLAGLAVMEDSPIYVDRSMVEDWARFFNRPQDRWPRKLSWREAQWALCVPYVHAPSNVQIFLVVDGNQPLELADLEPTLESIVAQVRVTLDAGLPSEEFQWL